MIGEGAFGTVHMGLNLETGELMAVKSIHLNHGEFSSAEAKTFENEIAILRNNKWGHPSGFVLFACLFFICFWCHVVKM